MSRSFRKPWWKDNNPSCKKQQRRRYRRVIRQDVKQWRNKYYLYESIFPGCGWCECLDEYWDGDADVRYWRECLSFELEPSYPHPHKFGDSYDICDWRYYVDEPEYRRK